MCRRANEISLSRYCKCEPLTGHLSAFSKCCSALNSFIDIENGQAYGISLEILKNNEVDIKNSLFWDVVLLYSPYP